MICRWVQWETIVNVLSMLLLTIICHCLHCTYLNDEYGHLVYIALMLLANFVRPCPLPLKRKLEKHSRFDEGSRPP